MFRRLRSALPKDPVFASDLKGLGYFINEKDEIRSIANPKAYFDFFITKNERYNVLQREGMNEAIRNIVTERLEQLGLIKLRLPLGASETDPHVNIFISDDLKEKKEIVVLFYEASQDIGIFAHRVIGGKGGLNIGSAVNFVKYIRDSAAKDDREAPGIILANLGQLYWSRRAKKSLSLTSWYALPRKSAADPAYDLDEHKNTIPGNRNTAEHVASIFKSVLGNPEFCDRKSKIHILGVSEGAVQATWFLHDQDNFTKWCKGVEHGDRDESASIRVVSLASVATSITVAENVELSQPEFLEITNPEFKKWFADHGRTYSISDEPAGQYLAPPEGCRIHQALSAPTFSLGETHYSERMLVVGHEIIVDWFAEFTADADYANPKFERAEFEVQDEPSENDDQDGEGWGSGDVIEYKSPPPCIDAATLVATRDAIKVTHTPLEAIEIPVNSPEAEKQALRKLKSAFKMLNPGVDMCGENFLLFDKSDEEGIKEKKKNLALAGMDDDFAAGLSLENVITHADMINGFAVDHEVGEKI